MAETSEAAREVTVNDTPQALVGDVDEASTELIPLQAILRAKQTRWLLGPG